MASDIEAQTVPTLASTESPYAQRRPLERLSNFGVWAGVGAYLLSLAGTLLLAVENARLYAVVLLLASVAPALLLWGQYRWPSAFTPISAPTILQHRRLPYLLGLGGTALLLLVANLYQAANPREVFGPAGWLWLACIGLLVTWSLLFSRTISLPSEKEAEADLPPSPESASVATISPTHREHVDTQPDDTVPTKQSWVGWEKWVFAVIVVVAFGLRVWNLRDYPNNVYPDEIMTGTVAIQSFLGEKPAPVFSTVWGDIELPALWFWIVAMFLKFGGTLLSVLRLPAALFGAATVVPFYLLMRENWGRVAAITGAAILAFSASNVHYSRLGLNNIVAQFFWVMCFLFLLRGLRGRRVADWTLAGLFAGLSEHFYYGTRLLPFILAAFFVYLLVIHWRQARRYVSYFALTALGYLVGFGPLLAYFITHPNLYLGRGTQMMVWNRIPTSFDDFGRMVSVLGPIISENLLGISTHTSQDIIYFGTLLQAPEAALLVLGTGLLAWKWRHPAAFLMLLAGVGVLFVGGSLVFYPNSFPPQINHWTPAFPVFYCALAIPVGLWLSSTRAGLPKNLAWVKPAILAVGIIVLGWINISYYFGSYHADPESLRSEGYRRAQEYYDAQVAQSRYLASLGEQFTAVVVGRSSVPYDPEVTSYLLGASVNVVNAPDPENNLPTPSTQGKGLAFIFFPGNEHYQTIVQARYPGGTQGSVTSPSGKLMFYTYLTGR